MIDTLLSDSLADDWRIYVPVLRAKASEWEALKQLPPGVRRKIAPVFEFVPDWKEPGATAGKGKRRTPQTPAEHIKRFLHSCAEATPSGTRSFLNFGLAGSDAKWFGMDLWSAFESQVPSQLRIIPLVDLAAARNSQALVSVARSHGEVGLRFSSADVGPTLANRIASTLEVLGVAATSAHVIMDLKDQPAAISHAQLRMALGDVDSSASVVVLGGVFPKDLMRYRQGVTSESREEWKVWWREHAATPPGERLLSFGDYTTQCAHYSLSPEVSGSVSLRYTTDEAILVFRGRQSKGSAGLGHEQMHGHCRLLVNRPDYDGAAFSEGDQRIHCWTDPANGTGNAMQWRTASIVHHITHTVAQLQDPVGSSANARAWARGQPAAECPRKSTRRKGETR